MIEGKELFKRALRKLGDLNDDQLREFMETEFCVKPVVEEKKTEEITSRINRVVGYIEINLVEHLCFLAEKANSEFNTVENRKQNIESVLEKEIKARVNSDFLITFTINPKSKTEPEILELIIHTKPIITEAPESEEFNTTKITLRPI